MEDRILKSILRLRDNGVKYIACRYSGGGDSGSIDEQYCLNESFDDDYANQEDDINKDHVMPGNLEDDINEDIFYKVLDTIEDWWNNDGGYGILVIRLKDMNYYNINNCYYTQTDTYNHEGKIELKA